MTGEPIINNNNKSTIVSSLSGAVSFSASTIDKNAKGCLLKLNMVFKASIICFKCKPRWTLYIFKRQNPPSEGTPSPRC